MKEHVKIALIQQSASEDLEQNVKNGIDAVISASENGANIICFAELAFTPFYPQHRSTGNNLELAQTIPGKTTNNFCNLAKELGVVIVLNLYEKAGEKTYDSSPVINSDGKILGVTRMLHITQYDKFFEQDYYHPGDADIKIYKTSFGNLGVSICYDRHYPEYMRALGTHGADIVFIPQAGAKGEWTDGLYEAEVRTAAFQNGYFTALCNRTGTEDELEFAGESFVCDPNGNVIARAGTSTEEILFADLNFDMLDNSFARKLFMKHRRKSIYKDWLDDVL